MGAWIPLWLLSGAVFSPGLSWGLPCLLCSHSTGSARRVQMQSSFQACWSHWECPTPCCSSHVAAAQDIWKGKGLLPKFPVSRPYNPDLSDENVLPQYPPCVGAGGWTTAVSSCWTPLGVSGAVGIHMRDQVCCPKTPSFAAPSGPQSWLLRHLHLASPAVLFPGAGSVITLSPRSGARTRLWQR